LTQSGPTDEQLLASLRAGDERAFATLIDRYAAGMRRFALSFVRSEAVADEVVQEAWLGLLRGLDRFEGRSSLKTWLYRIVANQARTRAVREARTIPFSDLGDDGPAVSPDRFQGADDPHPGGWVQFPQPWADLPEARLLAGETRAVIDRAIAALPPAQRIVITLRDVEGLASDEICNVLKVSETNQRVLLHRARSKVRTALETYFVQGET
jgi:RNA polymerase sigma-70 factor (ECF subfamily)